MMIMSVAHALVDEATAANVFGAWSDVVVGERPSGLVHSYLLKDAGVIQVAAIWDNVEDHDRALEEEENHPAFGVFESCGADPTHTVFEVIGHI